MLVFGVDIGIATNAIAIVDDQKIVSYTEFMETSPKSSLGARYNHLYSRFQALLKTYDIGAVSYEHPVMHTKQGHILSGVVALLTLATHEAGIKSIVGYSPTAIKKHITGQGTASKTQMLVAVRNLLGEKVTHNNHIIDAIAAGLMYFG